MTLNTLNQNARGGNAKKKASEMNDIKQYPVKESKIIKRENNILYFESN